MLYLRCLQVFSDNPQSCHFPVYHSINSYIFLSKFSNFLVITSLENRLPKNLIIRLFLIFFYYFIILCRFWQSYSSLPRACLKKAFCKMCVTICGRFRSDEGAVAGYGNRIRVKSPAK
ncbi:MAG: DUF6783 domain-containing protein [Ruminococcus sp.]